MNTETLCQICSQLVCSPILLSCCSASVCLECISNISQKEKRNPDKLFYKCPLCFKDHQLFEPKKINTFLSRYIEYSFQKGSFDDVDCENCGTKKNFAETFGCRDCNQNFLCKDCFSVSHNVSINKNHKTVNHDKIIKSFAGSLEKGILCHDHPSQKVEYICLKDLTTLCASCAIDHNKICKEKRLSPFEKAHTELAKQLSNKFEQLNEYRNKVDGEYSSLKERLEEYQTNSQEIMNSVEKQFQELREILFAKETELKNFLLKTFAHHKEKLNQEITDLDIVNKKTGNLISMVEFAVSFPDSYFCEGAKYLVHRFNKLSHSFSKLDHAKDDVHHNFKLQNFAESKEALLGLSLSEVEKPLARRTNVFLKSKTSVFNDDDTFAQTERLLTDFIPLKTENPFNETAITKVEKIQIPATPRTEVINLSKRSGLHSKNRSIAVNNPNFFGSFKLEKSPNHRHSQANSPSAQGQGQLRRDKYSNIFSKLNTNSSAKNLRQPPPKTADSSQNLKTAKIASQASTPSLQHSRTPSKSSFSFKTAPPKSSCESPKIKSFGSSIDLGNWTFNLSPQKREENPYTEQELELIQEVEKNPLVKRKFLKVYQTANSIYVSWPHSSQDTKITYQLDYGIGSIVQKTEQFRTAFKGSEESFIITGLAPKTKYRLKVCPVYPKEEDSIRHHSPNSNPSSVSPRGRNSNETFGPWSDIISVVTKDNQTIEPAPCASVSTTGKETVVDFEKAGNVVAKNEYEFGKTAWEIKIKRQSAHAAPVDAYSFLKIGVANKSGKSTNILGKLFNYALNTESITIKVFLDVDNRSMTVLTGNDKDSEVFNNLPAGPLYPAFQNKISKDSFSSLKLHVKFDLPFTLSESKDLG